MLICRKTSSVDVLSRFDSCPMEHGRFERTHFFPQLVAPKGGLMNIFFRIPNIWDPELVECISNSDRLCVHIVLFRYRWRHGRRLGFERDEGQRVWQDAHENGARGELDWRQDCFRRRWYICSRTRRYTVYCKGLQILGVQNFRSPAKYIIYIFLGVRSSAENIYK